MTSAGSGFVHAPEGDYYIAEHDVSGAFDGDLVEIVPKARKSNQVRSASFPGSSSSLQAPAARIARVLQRTHETLLGRYEVADPFGVVVAQDRGVPYDIFTMRSENPDIEDGSLVRVRIVQYPTRRDAACGVIEEVLGKAGDCDIDIESVIARHRLETRFSESSIRQASIARVDVEGALQEGYRDLRDSLVFTIDPHDARDFDDALSIEELDGGVSLLRVHIADVSHYVEWGTSIDLDARRRATSVYLADRVIPMLPPRLSDEICSLMTGAARRALTLEATIDDEGRMVHSRFYPSVIESKARLSYDQAQCIIDAQEDESPDDVLLECLDKLPKPRGGIPLDAEKLSFLRPAIVRLHALARRRAQMRADAGGIEFETTEAHVRLDEGGIPLSVELRRKSAATSMVEEAMQLANECAARRLVADERPALFRIHDNPSSEGLADVVGLLAEYDHVGAIDVEGFVSGNPFCIQEVLSRVRGQACGGVVTRMVLRSMQRAVYSDACSPHFALASKHYCHFTSPIRRYPDLVVHRMLKALFFGNPSTYSDQVGNLSWLARHCSDMERVSEVVARETQEIKLVEYMGRFVGSVVSGTIVSIVRQGVYIQLENTCEGFAPLRFLGDERFAIDPHGWRLCGEESGREYLLGQRVSARIVEAVPAKRKLGLRMVEQEDDLA